MKPIEVKIPDHKRYGEVRSNGNGDRTFRPNWKAIRSIIMISFVGFGVLTGATIWVHSQTTAQADTTKQVEILESKVDTLETEARIKQRTLNEKITWIMEQLDPTNAATKIAEINAREKVSLDDYKEKKKMDDAE